MPYRPYIADRGNINPPPPFGYPLISPYPDRLGVNLSATSYDPFRGQRVEAQPCPYANKLSLWLYGRLRTDYDLIHDASWLSIPAGSHMVVAYTESYADPVIIDYEHSNDAHIEGDICGAVSFLMSGVATSNGSVSWTIGGPGGYSASRTVTAGNFTVEMCVPYPCDVKRSISVSVTQGVPLGLLQSISWRGVLLPSGVPSGWDASDWFGRNGSGYFYQRVMSARAHPRQMALGSASAMSIGLNAALYGIFAQSSGQYGLPVWHNGAWHRSHVYCPGQVTICGGGGSSGLTGGVLVRHVTSVYARYRRSARIDVSIMRASDWSADGEKTVVIGTCTHEPELIGLDEPEYAFALIDTGIVSPDANGGKMGYISTKDNKYHPEDPIPDRSSFVEFYCVEEPCPLPIAVPLLDGTILPGATHAASRFVAQPVPICAVSGAHFPASARPSSGMYQVRFDNIAPGYYYISRTEFSSDYIDYPTSRDESVAYAGGAEGFPIYKGSMLHPGGSIYFCDYANIVTELSGERSLDLVSIPIAHVALSLGDTAMCTGAASIGLPGATYAIPGECLFAFAAFVAPIDGVYTLDFSCSFSGHARPLPGTRFAVWASTTDPLCVHDIPDAVEDVLPLYDYEAYSANAQPTSTTATISRLYAITGATDDLAQHNGKLASAVHRGANGMPLDLRMYDCPDGTPIVIYDPVAMTTIPHKRQGDRWVKRGEHLPRLTRTLTAGQTLYIRIGQQSNRGLPHRNGVGFWPQWIFNANVPLTVSVSAS